jgi:protein required for attachment to host cells
MATTWILVAEDSSARILKTGSRIGALQEHDRLEYDAGQLGQQDSMHDAPADADVMVRRDGHHTLLSLRNPRQQGPISFVEQVADYLDQAFNRNEFNQLIIIALPAFAGLLRKNLSNRAVAAVVMQMERSLGHHTVDEIRRHLPDHLPVLT